MDELYKTPWNSKIESIIVKIGEKAQIYSILHNSSAQFYFTLDMVLFLIQLFISSFVSIFMFFSFLNVCDTDNFNPQIVYGFLLFINSVSNSMQQYVSLQVIAKISEKMSKRYTVLYLDINKHMLLYRVERGDSKKYLEKVSNKFNKLIMINPKINCIVLFFYNKKFNKTVHSYNDIIPNTGTPSLELNKSETVCKLNIDYIYEEDEIEVIQS